MRNLGGKNPEKNRLAIYCLTLMICGDSSNLSHHADRPASQQAEQHTRFPRDATVQRGCSAMENSENNYREAVSLFCQLLKDAFSTPAKNSREARGQYIIALRHVASFCISMGGDNDLISQRFHRLALALFDVQFGSETGTL